MSMVVYVAAEHTQKDIMNIIINTTEHYTYIITCGQWPQPHNQASIILSISYWLRYK